MYVLPAGTIVPYIAFNTFLDLAGRKYVPGVVNKFISIVVNQYRSLAFEQFVKTVSLLLVQSIPSSIKSLKTLSASKQAYTTSIIRSNSASIQAYTNSVI